MPEKTPRKIILDTDLCGDCDDVGALALLLNLEKQGLCRTLCITHCLHNRWAIEYTQRTLEWFGKLDIPFGRLDPALPSPFSRHWEDSYVRPLCEPSPRTDFPVPEDSVRLLRRVLTANGGTRDITLCTIGMVNNIALLLQSGPDDISDKTGSELIAENVCEYVAMFGRFNEPENPECNVVSDIPASQYVVSNCPIPITYVGFEIGYFKHGHSAASAPVDHPVRASYLTRNKDFISGSWDPISVYYSVMGLSDLWKYSAPVHVTVLDDGSLAIDPAESGSRYLIQTAPTEQIVSVLDSLIL